MNYEQQVKDMLAQAGQATDRDRLNLLYALGYGITVMFSVVSDHKRMHELLHGFLSAIHDDCCDMHAKVHPDQKNIETTRQKAVSAEEFLRDHFKPEKMNG